MANHATTQNGSGLGQYLPVGTYDIGNGRVIGVDVGISPDGDIVYASSSDPSKRFYTLHRHDLESGKRIKPADAGDVDESTVAFMINHMRILRGISRGTWGADLDEIVAREAELVGRILGDIRGYAPMSHKHPSRVH